MSGTPDVRTMTLAELQQYRDLCRRWPECDIDTEDAWSAEPCGVGISVWYDHRKCDDVASYTAAVIHHLETAVLDKHAPGWSYGHRVTVYKDRPASHEYHVCRDVDDYFRSESRLAALLSACEAVLTAKGTTQ